MPKQRKKTPEGYVQSAITDFLAAEHVLHFRMNTGAMQGEHNGKKWFVRFGAPGMADLLAFKEVWCWWMQNSEAGIHNDVRDLIHSITPVWIEVKKPGGKQSPNQKSFQKLVESHGHRYILADSIDSFIEQWRS